MKLLKKWNQISLVKQILLCLVVGIVLSLTVPNIAKPAVILGALFVGALKAIAPVLVLLLVMSAIIYHKKEKKTNIRTILKLYFFSTVLSGAIAVILSFVFPLKLTLINSTENLAPPADVLEVLETLLFNIVDNPINALISANYIGILAWGVLFGLSLRKSSETTKEVIKNFSNAITRIVSWVIRLAPFGIMGLVIDSITTNGLNSLLEYSKLLFLLIGCMFFVAFVINPLIVYIHIRENPYPLTLQCIKESGITAFFTRSSAANIPINLKLCEKLGLEKDSYSVSIPLGATINMAGAAITISIMTMAAVHTIGIEVDIPTAIMLSVLSAIAACGTSGVAGGSLLLIPLACSLFGIPNEIAMQVVGVGFIIGVLQDSFETSLNSSTDVLFTAAAELKTK